MASVWFPKHLLNWAPFLIFLICAIIVLAKQSKQSRASCLLVDRYSVTPSAGLHVTLVQSSPVQPCPVLPASSQLHLQTRI
jgi:hypothetical protein